MRNKKYFYIILSLSAYIFIFTVFFTFISTSAQAASSTIKTTYTSPNFASEDVSSVSCKASNGCAVNGNTCNNGPYAGNSGNCGTACQGGNAWTKYNYSSCSQISFTCDSFGECTEVCTANYKLGGSVCSTGDKCVSGESGLRSGSCECGGYGTSTYKYCCNATGNSEACIAAGTQDASFPPEGQCPGGYIVDGSRVRSSACTPIITSTPTPSPTPTTNLCYSGDPCTAGQVGSSVCSGTGVSKTCYNFGGTYCWWPTTCFGGTACYAGVCRAGCAEGTTQSICIEGTSCNL